jgi:GT2 family glycosyltransferase
MGKVMQTALPTVATIVLNWNRKDDTLRCLDSLEAVDYPLNDVYVVDNASTDGSVQAIHEAFPGVEIVTNAENLGFAEGNNVGIDLALERGYDAVLLLNNDTVVASDSVRLLVDALVASPIVGIVSPAILYLARPGQIWSAGGSIDWRRGQVSSAHFNDRVEELADLPFTVDHVSGCCMLVRSDAIRRAGALDPRFFMYYEETEWCVRIGRVGYEAVVHPQARIWHDIAPDEQLGSPAIAYFMTRNQLLFLWTTKAPASAWAYTLFGQIRTVTALFIKPASLARMRGRLPMVRAMRDFALGRFGPMPTRRS